MAGAAVHAVRFHQSCGHITAIGGRDTQYSGDGRVLSCGRHPVRPRHRLDNRKELARGAGPAEIYTPDRYNPEITAHAQHSAGRSRKASRTRRVDSLQENRSSFFTEILRIRDVFELTEGTAPVLFLFDELLEGTNSNDRKIGAEGLFRALLERRAVGIVTTHDMALTEITGALSSVVRNVHFQDYVEDGKMRFDHKLRDGVVAKSNALELMRLIGLKV